METKATTYSPAFHLISWVALVGGILTYLIGLWNAQMELNQKTVRDKYEKIPTTTMYYLSCLIAFAIAVGLLAVGLWNATLMLSEKGFYGLAFFLSLFGAVAVQKNIRDVWDRSSLSEVGAVTEEPAE